MYKSSRSILISVLLLTIIFLQSYTIHAAEDFNGYSVTQTILKTTNKPGETKTKSLKVMNESGRPAKVTVTVRDFEVKDKQLLYKDDVPAEFSVAKWTSLNEQEFQLESKQSKEIILTIAVPENAEQGEHTALIAIQFLPVNGESKGTNVKVATEILPVLYTTVTDQNGQVNLQKKWTLNDFTYEKQKSGTFLYKFAVQNEGNVHLESSGSIEIKNRLTGSKQTIKVPTVNLLSKADKIIAVEWRPEESFGWYDVTASFSMDEEKYETKNLTVYVIPWKIVGASVGVLVLIILIIRFYFRRMKQRMMVQLRTELESKKVDHL